MSFTDPFGSYSIVFAILLNEIPLIVSLMEMSERLPCIHNNSYAMAAAQQPAIVLNLKFFT